MTPYYQSESAILYHGDAVAVLQTLADCSVDSIVTDPPAGISFMGKDWDHHKGGRDAWVSWLTEVMRECLRVLKPGGHALVWALPRTSHWTAWAIEGAGFQIRDRVSHLFGSGFPKSLSVSRAIDDYLGVERSSVGLTRGAGSSNTESLGVFNSSYEATSATSWAAKQFEGFGTALKPACEDWWLCRKPLEGTVAENVLKHGTGGLNIDGCRIEGEKPLRENTDGREGMFGLGSRVAGGNSEVGRWPANVMHDGSDEVVGLFPETHGSSASGYNWDESGNDNSTHVIANIKSGVHFGDSGSVARFFYCAKTSQQDRNEGLEDLELLSAGQVTDRVDGSAGLNSPRAGAGRNRGSRNFHPTVKPLALMRYLVRLITPPDGLVLDCFCGSGSTGKAAIFEDFRFIGIELDEGYCKLAQRRIEEALRQNQFKQQGLFPRESYERQPLIEQPVEHAATQSGLFATVAGE